MRRCTPWMIVPLVTCLWLGCRDRPQQGAPVERFIQAHVARVEPLATQANLAYWEAQTTGRSEAFARLKELQLEIRTLWWDLVERYQLLRRPSWPVDAGWASKLHFVSAPCYYHNYVLGELLASQFEHCLRTQVLDRVGEGGLGFTDDPRIGALFRDRVFRPGALYPWDEMIERTTGEPLTSRYFAEQFSL